MENDKQSEKNMEKNLQKVDRETGGLSELNIEFEYCYGIKKLKAKFDFTKESVVAIYASNGMMKSSFANTFEDLKNGEETKDKLYPGNRTKRIINNENGNEINKNDIYVLNQFNDVKNTESVSVLLADINHREKYDEISNKIVEYKKEFLNAMTEHVKFTHDEIERKIKDVFSIDDFYEILEINEHKIKATNIKFVDIPYDTIFNEDVHTFIKTTKVKAQIIAYIEQYNLMLEKSEYLKKDFDYYDAKAISKTLKTHKFFEAKHSLNLFNGQDNIPIENEYKFNSILQKELETILKDKSVREIWYSIDKQLSKNDKLRSFRDYLRNNQLILTELIDIEEFAKKVWISYFSKYEKLFRNLLEEFRTGKEKMEEIVKIVEKQKSDWNDIIEKFNDRFHVPFEVSIGNKSNSILNDATPSIEFIHKDSEGTRSIEKTELQDTLSTGELKALYILDILYIIEARKKEKQKTLLIIDDIVDSFDYKNKYAFIQYLYEISQYPSYNIIILTHNFDFLRTIVNRAIVSTNHCHFTYIENNEIKLTKDNELISKLVKNNVFKYWSDHLEDPKNIIALISFVRNIIDYTKGSDDQNYKKLSSLLHYKEDTCNICIKDLKIIFKEYFKIDKFKIEDDVLVIDKIFSESEKCLSSNDGVNFENKIILSIGIRILAEKYISLKNGVRPADSMVKVGKLINDYKEKYSNDKQGIKLLEKTNLITPENIHLNSFMYEPIIDMSDIELKKLYTELSDSVLSQK